MPLFSHLPQGTPLKFTKLRGFYFELSASDSPSQNDRNP
jgi:hypothetical protein